MRTSILTACVFGCLAAEVCASSVYWRFENGLTGQPVTSSLSDEGQLQAVAGTRSPSWSDDVPMAIIPLSTAANHESVNFDGGWLRATACPVLNVPRNFTVEMWAKFGAATGGAQVLASKGVPGPGNWHIIRQVDGSVRANIFGGAEAYLFDLQNRRLLPDTWYHLAAVYEDIGGGRMRIRTFVNGQLRGAATGPALQDTSAGDLFLGAFADGQLPFHGSIDEFRFTTALLKPTEFLIGGARPIPEQPKLPKPLFVKEDTQIDTEMRSRAAGTAILAEPTGYPYFFKYTTGGPLPCASVPDGYDPGFRSARVGWSVITGGAAVGYQFAVRPGGTYLVAAGFFDPRTSPPKRVQRVVIDGQVVDTFDTATVATQKPCVRKYEVRDADGDGYLGVACSQTEDELGYTGLLNVVWVFAGAKAADVDVEQLAHGTCGVPPMYYIQCGREDDPAGHVGYASLSAATRAGMLPMRPVPLDLDPKQKHPQPADPRDVVIRGDLADRIHTYLDRWGTCGRDQKLPAGFLSDSGYEVVGRSIETLYLMKRLMRLELDLKESFDALLASQDKTSQHPGAFVGGLPVRTGFIWSQGTILSGLMAYHEATGSPQALVAAGQLADWYRDYLTQGDFNAANYFAAESKFTAEGATVGHLGKGALEPLIWLYWRTKNAKYLELARQIAALNRQWGGVAWMIHGDLPADRQKYEGWHIHANLTTIRGFPWLYAATGDRSYLDDAIAACDRVFERATWDTGGVLEQIPWKDTKFPGPTPDPHDETCQTSDLLQLSYLLGEFTGEGRFYDRAEHIYYNHIRYMQMHNGDFTAFNRLPGPQRGGDAWFCCGFWGGKALYEAARHLYASSPNAVYVNGFMPSSVEFTLKEGVVKLDAEADIPRSGKLHLAVDPQGPMTFDLDIRVPGWGRLQSVAINCDRVAARPQQGYITLTREWKPGDVVDVQFDLPLRVVWTLLGMVCPQLQSQSMAMPLLMLAPSLCSEGRSSWRSFAWLMAPT
ncbi:MAG: LamG-like jellyroll fold domain-containing protein [Pirellulaceae bacterium]